MMIGNCSSNHMFLLYIVLLLRIIAAASFSTDGVAVTPSSKRTVITLQSYGVANSGKNLTGGKVSDHYDDETEYHTMYTRLIPAVSTVGIFLFGFIAICISYIIKVKNGGGTKEPEPVPDLLVTQDNDWFTQLKKTQKKSPMGLVLNKRAQSFQAKLLSRDKKATMKKYALYDDMLARYKRSLKIQQLHSMRKLNTTMSNVSQSTDDDESIIQLKRISSRTRIKELAMRHKISQEHLHAEFNMDPSSRQRHLPRWGTTSSNQSQDGGDGLRLRSPTDTEIELFREELDRSIEQSPNVSFQTSTDDDTEPLLTTRLPTNVPSMEEMQEPKNEEVNLLDEPDIVESLKKLSVIIEQPIKVKKRPKSMSVSFSDRTAITSVNYDDIVRRIGASDKRKSWYQGLFKSAPKKPHSTSVDDLIEARMKEALFSRLSSEVLDDVDVNDGVEEDRSKKKSIRKRPKSWVPSSETQRQKGRKISDKEDTITELFANLMDLPPIEPRPRSHYDNAPGNIDSSLDPEPQFSEIKDQEKVEPRLSVTEEFMILNEVERRMIANIHEEEIKKENEVTALESLLNDVARFCTEYSEDYADIQSRRNISFSEANETLSRSTTPTSRYIPSGKDSFDERKEKAVSVYDTYLLESKGDPNLSTTL